MAISDRIKAEARRTIDGMQRFYEKYSDETDDREELEHRIARVEASMEGCNGLTQDEKIQKTAENVFELTCAQERSYDALRLELRDQLARVPVRPGAAVRALHRLGDVPAQGEYIDQPRLAHPRGLRRDVRAGGGDAGQVREHGQVVLLLNLPGQADGVRAGAAARAVGDADVGRAQRRNVLRRA